MSELPYESTDEVYSPGITAMLDAVNSGKPAQIHLSNGTTETVPQGELAVNGYPKYSGSGAAGPTSAVPTAATSPETTTAAPTNEEPTTSAPTSTEPTAAVTPPFASRWFAAFMKFISFGDTKL